MSISFRNSLFAKNFCFFPSPLKFPLRPSDRNSRNFTVFRDRNSRNFTVFRDRNCTFQKKRCLSCVLKHHFSFISSASYFLRSNHYFCSNTSSEDLASSLISCAKSTANSNLEISQALSSCIRKIRELSPIVLCLADNIPRERIADVLLSCGAIPNITYHPNELEEYLDVCTSVYFNASLQTLQNSILETLTAYRRKEEFSSLSSSCANNSNSSFVGSTNKLVLDVTNYGLSNYRNKQIKFLLENSNPNVIKCNAAEALCLATHKFKQDLGCHGNSINLSQVIEACKEIALQYKAVILVSGIGIVIDSKGERIAKVFTDAKQVTKFSGSGCSVGVLCSAALAASDGDDFLSAYTSLLAYKVCTRDASKEAKGPGSLAVLILDKLSKLSLSPDNLLNEKIEISFIN